MKFLHFPKTGWKKIVLITLSILALLVLLPIFMVTGFILAKCPNRDITISIQDHTTDRDGLKIYYRTAGDPTKQSVVFLHGWACRLDGRCGTDAVIAELAKDFFVIAPEHPGFIRSEAPTELWSYKEYANALHALLIPLKLQKPIVMGQSFGGGIATAYAAQYPENLGGIVLVDAVMTNRPYNWYMRIKHTLDELAVSLMESKMVPTSLKRTMTSLWLGTPFSLLDDQDLQRKAIMWKIDKYKDIEKPLDVDYTKLSAPLILIWGESDTFTTPLARAREIHAQVPASELIVVPGSHTILYQKPDEVVPLITSKLQEL